MRGWNRHQLIEGGFVAALLAVCVVLTTLQSRWTSDLGRATSQQQATQLRSQAQLFCRAFDTELNEACAQLRPQGSQIESLGRDAAHAQTLRAWQAGNPRPMFRRLAVAVPEGRTARLYLLDQKTARLVRTEWPPEWTALQRNLSLHVMGGPASPFVDETGFLREYPVFSGRGPGGPGESWGPGELDEPSETGEAEWFIAELDPDYLQQKWLPELVRAFLNSGKVPMNEVRVQTRSSPSAVIFSTVDGQTSPPEDAVSLAFNRKPRIGRVNDENSYEQFWALFTWPRAGMFAAAVSNARARDFTLACILDGGLLLGGLLIIYYARRARRVGDARMQFVTAVSHELRTPLTVIRAAGQNLRRGIVRDPARIERYADLIIEHSDRLADMIEQVLAFAGATRNRPNVAHFPLAVAPVVREAVETCAAETQAAGCEVQVAVEDNLPPVLGDAHALRQVFQNLLTNAAKHGAGGRWIGVYARHVNGGSPGCVEVAVSDHGDGIPPREQPQVFEPFFRGSRARGQQARGSGIGLSVVREIVKLHRGSVRVESPPGRGTTFVVSLPAASPAELATGS